MATAHKAIKELNRKQILEIIRPKSRRFAITYIYRGDIEGFDDKKEDNFQLDYLKNLVQEMKEEIIGLKQQVNTLKGENMILINTHNNSARK